ncbi:ATP-dependent nuclease [Stakelama saccharophila]|uniref:AAA family ATPase n=1 Tax=Stakelama saccharophila TaxID=3075605 RepID=A0ABZ0B7B1_9SPHN|nr:AAA family ATPase [Stakelama sp. W311]WNO53175.1 AAA family ATPase [Stakelama sp. W311]
MKITRVVIRNWRSVKDIDFYPEDITVLVGPNNAGKTNIMSAINFLMGDRWPMPANLNDQDFYLGDRKRDIYIAIYLDHPEVGCIEFDTSKDKYVLTAYDDLHRPIYGFNNAYREQVAFAYVDAARSFERQFGISRWTMFGQAVRLLHEDLKAYEDGAALPPLKDALDKAHEILRTELYVKFEKAMKDAFAAQLKSAGYDVSFEFRTIDETNLYRSLYPMLVENGKAKSPSEVGSGVRNLLVLALFQAFAESFRGGAILGIEEPELYLHPHAQRSLASQFEDLAALGNQVFISTHSAAFLDITLSERIVIVDRCPDDEREVCSSVRTSSTAKLLAKRNGLYPAGNMSETSLRAFLRNVKTVEMAEPYFARMVIIVEGQSEREALPMLLARTGLQLDAEGISIVAAGGKTVLDTLVHLYGAHDIPTYVIFDNDKNGTPAERNFNMTLCRLLGRPETDLPAPVVAANYAILDGDWEHQVEHDVDALYGAGYYASLVQKAKEALLIVGKRNKPLIARWVAEHLGSMNQVPPFVLRISAAVRAMLPGRTALPPPPPPPPPPVPMQSSGWDSGLDDDVPF